MRIAMVGPFGFRPKKTMRARAFRIARALAKRHEVAIFMPPWHTPAEADSRYTEDGVYIRNVPLDGGIPGTTRRLLSETVAWQPTVVHCFKPKAYSGLVATWLWQRQRKRLRVVMDTDDWEGWGGWNDLDPYTPVQKHFFAWQEKWGMTHCHALTVASRALETLALGHGVRPEQLVYLPNGSGIPLSETDVERDPDPTLLLYTRFFEYDVARLVAVLLRVQQAVPALKLLLVGASLHDEHGARFERLMRQAELWALVDHVGWVEEAAVAATLGRAHAGVYLMDDTLLNRTKCPVKLADQLAVGVPVVGEAVGQLREYIQHGENGYLAPSGDVAGVADGLIRLLTDSAENQRLSKQAVVHMRGFEWEKLAALAERAYSR